MNHLGPSQKPFYLVNPNQTVDIEVQDQAPLMSPEEQYNARILGHLASNGLTKKEGTQIFIIGSFNQSQSHNKQLRYHEQQRLARQEPKVSQIVGPLFFLFWLLSIFTVAVVGLTND